MTQTRKFNSVWEMANRKLAAIMFTDIEGYTAMMQHSEEEATRARAKHRRIFKSVTGRYRGQILQYYGDGTLSVFDSAIDAVECAIELQNGFREDPVIPVRIGIHTGDIVFSEEEIIGDGVNIASRLESMAVPGSILVSEKVYDEIKNHASVKSVRLQEYHLKNVDRPVEIYAIANAGLIVPAADEVRVTVDTKPVRREPRPTKNHKRNLALLTMAIIAVILVVYFNNSRTKPVTDDFEKSIAVLPFVNMSGDPEQDYFSDGMTDEIINALAQIDDLKVSGRTSSFYFKDKDVKLSKIGEELNVNTILEGSVQKSNNRVRVIVQLIHAADEYHIWSERYDREMEDIFALQDDISSQIADKMKITLAGGMDRITEHQPTTNMEAYEMDLRGRYFRDQGVEGLVKARTYLEKAIALDSGYARAYGDLAGTYFLLSVYKFIPPAEGFGKALELGRKAIALDPTLPGRHLGLATYYFWVAWDWEAALNEYKKEMDLGSPPNIFYPVFETFMYGNFDAAIEEAQTIVEADPLNVELLRNLTIIYSMARRYEDARTVAHEILDLNPSYSEAYRLIGSSYMYEGEFDTALKYFRQAAGISGGRGYATTDIIIALAAAGQNEEAQQLFSELQDSDAYNTLFAFELANIYFSFGDIDKVFTYLEQAYQNREFWLLSMKVDPGWDPLRDDPRFQELLKKMHFPE